MAEGDGLDEMEYKNLLGAVAGVEALLAYAAPGVRPLYESFLNNAKSQLDFLKKKVEGRKEEQERHDQQQAAMMQLAQKEAALSQSEKETYNGLLGKDFFTKRDFGNPGAILLEHLGSIKRRRQTGNEPPCLGGYQARRISFYRPAKSRAGKGVEVGLPRSQRPWDHYRRASGTNFRRLTGTPSSEPIVMETMKMRTVS